VLAVALAAYVMVKFYAIVFLGRPREPNLAYAKDPGPLERAALASLAVGCVALGLFPVAVLDVLDRINATLVGATVDAGTTGGWFLLAPVDAARSSYSPLIVLAVVAGVVLLAIQIVHRVWHGRARMAPPWDCGFPQQTPRMQDTAEGFGQPIRQVFEPFFRIERHLPSPFDREPRYRVTVADHAWHGLYLPLVRAAEFLGRQAGRLQQGRIAVYLVYSFVTLLALLYLVR
jgi:hydrogenase-4 component B